MFPSLSPWTADRYFGKNAQKKKGSRIKTMREPKDIYFLLHEIAIQEGYDLAAQAIIIRGECGRAGADRNLVRCSPGNGIVMLIHLSLIASDIYLPPIASKLAYKQSL